jgi:uncharacterized membrane protein
MRLHPGLRKTLLKVDSSLWVKPSLWIAGGLLLGLLLPMVDDRWAGGLGELEFTRRWIGATASGSMEVLATATTALGTILAVAFSITMVTVQLASSQYSPRLLRTFMSDRTTQRSLGFFIGTITYLLVVLRAFREPETPSDEGFLPVLAFTVGLLLTLACLALLVVYLHHTARSVQAASIIARVGRTAIGAVQKVKRDDPLRDELEVEALGESTVLTARRTGYVQLIDEDRLAQGLPAAVRLCRLDVRTGDFVFPGVPLLTLWPRVELSEQAREELTEAFATGRERTHAEDILFGVRQLVDVALKALSPSLNDVTTAVMVVNELGAVTQAVMQHAGLGRGWRLRPHGQLVLAQRAFGLVAVLEDGFREIPRAAKGYPRVIARLFEVLGQLAEQTSDPHMLAELEHAGTHILAVIEDAPLDPQDRAALDERWLRLRGAVAQQPQPSPPRETH